MENTHDQTATDGEPPGGHTHRGQGILPDGGVPGLSETDKREMLRTMLRIRAVETAWGDAWREEEIEGIVPSLSTGQEAIPTGANQALDDGDFQFTTHRGQGPQIARGLDPERVLAELYMRRDGYNKGKSYHVTDVEQGVIGMGGIIAAQVPVAGGKALAQSFRDGDRVSLAYFGEGSSNEGAIHETLNLASMWDLPLIMVCENNQYNISQPAETAITGPSVAARASGYGLPGETVDGNDPIAVYQTVASAVERARAGRGATLIEAETIRLDGHLTHDPQRYRSDGELADAWEREPIKRFKTRLEAEDIITQEEYEQMQTDVESTVESAVEFARESPYPDPEEAYEDLWA